MKIKKLYKYDRGRQIFRILPTDSNKLILEERDREKKEVYFSCLDIYTGKKIFFDFQFEEKYWIGIEKIFKDIIFFHRYERPDLPNHKGIIAYDIKSQTILWENPNKFLLVADDKVVLSKNEYGIQKLFTVDYLSGEIENEANELLNLSPEKEDLNNYIYSRQISQDEFLDSIHMGFKKRIDDYLIKDYVNFIQLNNVSLYSFHCITKNGKFDNMFFAVDDNGNIILKEYLSRDIEKLEPESFFIKDNLLFILFGRSGFGVYKLI